MVDSLELQRHRVGTADEVPVGGCLQVTVNSRSLGVFRVGEGFRAYLNLCPHEGAPICEGTVLGTTLPSAPGTYVWGRENEILVCPWHGWEFSLLDGACLTDRRRLASYAVEVDGKDLYVLMRGRPKS